MPQFLLCCYYLLLSKYYCIHCNTLVHVNSRGLALQCSSLEVFMSNQVSIVLEADYLWPSCSTVGARWSCVPSPLMVAKGFYWSWIIDSSAETIQLQAKQGPCNCWTCVWEAKRSMAVSPKEKWCFNQGPIPCLIAACCVLHNICEDCHETFHDDWIQDETDSTQNSPSSPSSSTAINSGKDVQKALMMYFNQQ